MVVPTIITLLSRANASRSLQDSNGVDRGGPNHRYMSCPRRESGAVYAGIHPYIISGRQTGVHAVVFCKYEWNKIAVISVMYDTPYPLEDSDSER